VRRPEPPVPEHRQGHVRGRDKTSGLAGRTAFSTSALWFDFDRDGRLDLFVCNYVRWSAEHDFFCSVDGKRKAYCTPEAFHGDTCWLFRNRGNGTFEDVTETCGIFDTSSKSLGVAMIDDDEDGWPDLFVANDTQPNKLYRNQRNGTFKEVAVEAGVAFSADGKARAGMGRDAADFDGSGRTGIAVTNFDNEMIGPLPSARARAVRRRRRPIRRRARSHARRSASAARSPTSISTARSTCSGRQRPHRRNGPPDPGARRLRAARAALPQSGQRRRSATSRRGRRRLHDARVGRGLAVGDFDRDGDVDVLMTTNNGPPCSSATTHTGGAARCASS
jgi:hypothetical protein